jgi:hypothetical protein
LQKGYLKNLIIVTGFDAGPGQPEAAVGTDLLDLHRRGVLKYFQLDRGWVAYADLAPSKGHLATPWFASVANTCILGVLEKPG